MRSKENVRSVLDAAVEGEPLLSAKVVLEQLLGVVDERIGGVDLCKRPRVEFGRSALASECIQSRAGL